MPNSRPRLINSIRCFAALKNPINVPIEREDFYTLFPTQLAIQNIAERVFLKLRELNFCLIGFSELHIVFYPDEDTGVKHAHFDGVHSWKRDIYVAMDPEKWRHLDLREQETYLVNLLCAVCRFVCIKSELHKVDASCEDLIRLREELSIRVFEKDIQSYKVSVFCRVPSIKGPTRSEIRYHDKKSQLSYREDFVDVEYIPDLILLCGTVSLKSGVLTMMPRQHYYASDFYLRYGAPIKFNISEMEFMG